MTNKLTTYRRAKEPLPNKNVHLVPTFRRGNAARTLRRPTSDLVSGTPERSNGIPTETIGTRQKLFFCQSLFRVK
jgi:hypothetical protein